MQLVSKILTGLVLFFNVTLYGQENGMGKLLEQIHDGTDLKREFLASELKQAYENLKLSKTISQRESLLKIVDSLNLLFEENNKKELLLEFDFINANPSHPIALDIMLRKIYKSESQNLHDTFQLLYDNLTPELKSSDKGLRLNGVLQQIGNSRIGSIAPDFKFVDINGNSLELSSFREKGYVLLDFWASWCSPCRAEFPFLKELYSKYSSQGLVIINVSRDNDLKSWRKAIKKDAIGEWFHVSTKLNDNKILSDYFVAALPMKVLIDKEGKIIGRWRGGGEENKEGLVELLAKCFDGI